MSINLAILWHMHQPYYFDPLKNKFILPWVRLHATKDYLDMLLLLEEFPDIKVTFNIVPSLLKQIREYENGATDLFMEITLIPAEELKDEQKIFILENFFLANWQTMIYPFPRYRELLDKRGKSYGDLSKTIKKFTTQEFRDLQVLFNLVWIDPLHRINDKFLKELERKGREYTEEEKNLLINKQIEILKKIIPHYKKLALSNQIELSVSPFYHPILPLIYDNFKAKETMPNVVLPKYRFIAPEDAKKQITKAIEYFEAIFGFKPDGLWPSEGSVSEEIIELIKDSKISWIATDEEILSKSLGEKLREGDRFLAPEKLYSVYEFNGVKIFFRDRILSDLIGFVYSKWQHDYAVNDFIGRLKKISYKDNIIIPVILDGENAWEYYEKDGLDFLRTLYKSLSEDREIRTVTFSEYLSENPPIKSLRRVFPGSWINANFSIWIGHEEDNLSWDYLYQTRQDLIKYQNENPSKDLYTAWEEIYIAEGSDWNWWFGDEHYTETKDVFDEIYRHHLINVYREIGKEPPSYLYTPIIKKVREIKPDIEPKGFIYPKIDGKVTGYFEWLEAGKYILKRFGGSMHKSEGLLSELYYGFNKKFLYIRLDPSCPIEDFKEFIFQIQIIEPVRIKVLWKYSEEVAQIIKQENGEWIKHYEIENVALDSIFEIEIPLEKIGIKEEENIYLFVEILMNNHIIERAPSVGFIKIQVPNPEFDKLMWL